jgi:hypothetical protein
MSQTMPLEVILKKIYKIRGSNVMLDFEIAQVYGVEIKSLNLSIKRNLKKFTDDRMFKLTTTEWEDLRHKIKALRVQGGIINTPFAFTEEGLLVLRSILKTDKANEINFDIMSAFVVKRPIVLTEKFKQKMKEISDLIKDGDTRSALKKLFSIYDLGDNIDDIIQSNEEAIDDNKWVSEEEILAMDGTVAQEITKAFNEKGYAFYYRTPTSEEKKTKKPYIVILLFMDMINDCRKVFVRYRYENRSLNAARKEYNKSREDLLKNWYTPKRLKNELIKAGPRKTHIDNGDTGELAKAAFPAFKKLTDEKFKGGFGMKKTVAHKFIIGLLNKVFHKEIAHESVKKAIQNIEKAMAKKNTSN